MTKKDIGAAIKQAMRINNVTPNDMALQSHQIEGILKGNSNYTVDSLIKACDHAGLEIDLVSKKLK